MKLFSKIATALVGMAMAVGVGVAVSGNNSKEVRAGTANWTASAQGFSNEQQLAGNTYAFDDTNVSVTWNTMTGTNGHKYYNSGTAVRSYGGESFTISCSAGDITAITLSNTQSKTVTADVGTYSNNAWSGSAASITFTVASGSGNFRTSTIDVVYSGGGTTTYTVTYNANEHGTGTMTDSNSPYTSGAEVTVLANAFVADTDYEFVDFNTAADGSGTSYDAGDKFEISANTTLYAQWNYTGVGPDVSLVASSTSDFVSPWSVDNTPSGIEAANRGWQWSSGKSAVITYSTDKSVSKVVVSATTNGSGSLAVTVGGNDFDESTAITSTKTAYTFEGNETGDVVITLTNTGTKSVYADRIEIYFNNLIETKIVNSNDEPITEYEFTEGDSALVFKYFDENDQGISGGEWETSDSSVISVSPNGTTASIAPVGAGTATVTASKEGYKPATVTFTVAEDPEKPEMEIWDNTWKVTDASGYWWTDEADLYWFYAHPVGDTERDPYERTILDDVSWDSSDKTVATITTQPGGQGSVTCLKPGETTLTATKLGYKSVSVTVSFNAGSVTDLLVSGSMTKTAYVTGDSWDPSGLVVKAYHDNTGWEDVVTSEATWTWSPAAPAEGVTSVVATAHWNDGEDDFAGSSDPQAVTFTVKHAGTADDPFTVAEGIAKCEEIGNVSGGKGPWVTTGKISSIVQVLTTGYQNARFYITEDGKTTSDSLYAYDCKYLGNAGFTEETAANMVVGATVTITGNLLNYNNNTPEYARGCYLLDIQEPETGDVDVTFDPASSSYEIGATGTFTASSETSGAVFTWSVDDSTVLSVDASTGAFEALELGVARVTVTATAGGKQGTAFADIVVNGSAGSYYSVSNANSIASGVASGKTTAYYIYVEGYVKEFATSSKDGNPRAFDIMTLDESSSIMVYTNVDPYAEFVDGLSLGDRIVVKGKIQNFSGTYEIVEPEKVGSNTSAITFSLDFISQTDAVCEGYDGKTNNKAALEAIWGGLSTSYSALFDNQKSILMGAEGDEDGTTIEKAVARYDYLVTKYGLDNFISGRTPSVGAVTQPISVNDNNINSTMSIVVVAVIAITSLSAIGVLLVIKRRKSI